MFNKRVDAVRIKDLDGFHSIVPYVMPKRTEAEVSMTENFDVTKLLRYMKTQNKKKDVNLKLFHAICTAMAKTIYNRPKMNIFIAGRYFWQRNDITLSFVAKQKFADNSEEALMFLKVEPDMNIHSISRMILGDVQKAREAGTNDLGDTMDFVGHLPRFILEIVFWVLKKLEYFGAFPPSLMKGDPNYSTCLLANLGSIGCGAPYHHLSNYGTCSEMVTIGTLYHDDVTKKDYVPMTFTLDERIADGFYFAKSLRMMKKFLEDPKLLEETIGSPIPEEIQEN